VDGSYWLPSRPKMEKLATLKTDQERGPRSFRHTKHVCRTLTGNFGQVNLCSRPGYFASAFLARLTLQEVGRLPGLV